MNQKESKIEIFMRGVLFHIKVWRVILSKSLTKSLAYRFEFSSKIVRTLLIFVIQLLLVKAIYSSTESIAGVSIDEYYLLLGIFNFVNYISWGLFNINFWRMEERVLNGSLDFYLLTPTNSIFMTAFNEFHLDDAIASISGLVLILYYFIKHLSEITFFNIFAGLIAIICAFIIWFALHLIVASMNFIFLKNGLLDLLKSFTRIGSFPPSIFSENIKILLYTVFPIALISAVPTSILIGSYSNWPLVLYSVIISIFFLTLSTKIWYWALRSYTSAGG